MTSIYETAYPRFKLNLSEKDIKEVYTPTPEELELINRHAHQTMGKLGLLINLKVVQRLGYFVSVKSIPKAIVQHLAVCINLKRITLSQLTQYDRSGAKQRHMKIIRSHLNILPFNKTAKTLVEQISTKAAKTKNELADIVNIVIEELVRHRFELPGFTTLLKAAKQARRQINNQCYQSIYEKLTVQVRSELDTLLEKTSSESGWQRLKREPKSPTQKEVKRFIKHLHWLHSFIDDLPDINDIPVAKYQLFVLEARSLDIGDLSRVKASKRYCLMVVFIHAQFKAAMDDIADILIKKIRSMHTKAQQRLQAYHLERVKRIDQLIGQFKNVINAYQDGQSNRQKVDNIEHVFNGKMEQVLSQCEEHLAYAGNNYYPFMLSQYQSLRPVLFNCLDILNVQSASNDDSMIKAIEWMQEHRSSHKEFVSILSDGGLRNRINLNWLPEKWRKLVFSFPEEGSSRSMVHRKYLELAIFSQVMNELLSADLFVKDSDAHMDYREQLVDTETYDKEVEHYGELVGLSTDADEFVYVFKTELTETALLIDESFPENAYASFTDKGLVVHKYSKNTDKQAIERVDELITERLEKVSIMDVLVDSEKWLDLYKMFKPISGFDSKLDDPRKRFITTLFCYGCNLGPSQTARSVKGLSRKQVAWLNLHYVTEERLEKALVSVINAYNRFQLPGFWGSGNSASADGTMWNVYEENLISEYHIRYGGYGGLGYYHVSDKYIALFSHFIPCGVYEAIYILDGLLKNESDIQPDTLHGDTQAQSTPVFGLAYLLGINLMPRIRDIKKLIFYRPEKGVKYEHINSLFGEAINWELIKKHLPDMLRVAISIKTGKITASTILKRLGTYSRKNKLYFAFRELGRAVRTNFLLKFIGDIELRHTINAATNKSEEFNGFTKWLFFGGEGMIAENLRYEQRKIIKYNQLVANLVILYNVDEMTKILNQLKQEGYEITDAILAGLSPYRTNHINRFGDYTLDLKRKVAPMNYKIKI
ncbi:Tn3 family transposase [Pleionea litopenaei]|uniref:Tn3 family transposase n=1 Tax=Pleionea litopenaei TaxID=3070815 RepID=A0AA51RUS9_9GAMM|nr:Tn3 family transposase [Pleionea sp. HL-JVS1]WMS87889.1 Tn3 family transposase [Pleionea sp. HL-JVS1]